MKVIWYVNVITFIYHYGKIFRAVVWWPLKEVRIYLEHSGSKELPLQLSILTMYIITADAVKRRYKSTLC